MQNPKHTIVMMLRLQMENLDNKRVQALCNLAASNAVPGREGPNPMQNMAVKAIEAYEDMEAAYHYAINQFIEPRQWSVTVKGGSTYRVPASTETDARLLACALEQMFPHTKYNCDAVMAKGDIADALKITTAHSIQSEM